MAKPKVTARVYQDGQDRVIEVHGQLAKALLALVETEDNGCTAQEVASWAYRFAPHVRELRHRYALVIRTDRELDIGGWQGRYVLETPVEILSVEGIEHAFAT